MAVMMFVTNGAKSAALIDGVCLSNGIKGIDLSVEPCDVRMDIHTCNLSALKLQSKERFYELAKEIAGVDVKDAIPEP